jgi:tRNA pseudouridine38-40 synthase
MPRFVVELAFDGTRYSGWQKQPDTLTVQGEVESGLAIVFKQPVSIMGSGRTDAGVHAEQQFAHFDVALDDVRFDKERFLHSLRSLIPGDVLIKDIREVDEAFHARFDAISRQYRYQIAFERSVFDRNYTWYVGDLSFLNNMLLAANLLVGNHNFESFSKNNPDLGNSLCTVSTAEFREVAGGLHFRIKSNRFLHHMVRSIIGNLVDVGRGKLALDDFALMLEHPDRSHGGFTAPAKGLFLEKIEY